MRAHNESGCLMWGSRWNEGICFDFWPILYEKGEEKKANSAVSHFVNATYRIEI